MSPEQALQSIDAAIEARHVLKHPFYLAWQRGELSRDALRTYAAQYYRHVSAFPTYISALHSRCEDLETRQALLRNLRDEEEGPDHHPGLWLRFAAAVGCDPDGVEAAGSLPETDAAIEAFRDAVGDGPVERGLAALYAYESMIPAVATEKIRGLAEHYGVEGSPETDYFEVHRTLDVEHAKESREALARRLRKATGAERAEAVRGAGIALDAVNRLLDGVCRVHGIARAA